MHCAWDMQPASASALAIAAVAAAASAVVAELVQRRERCAAVLLGLVSRAGRRVVIDDARARPHQRCRVGGPDAVSWSHVPSGRVRCKRQLRHWRDKCIRRQHIQLCSANGRRSAGCGGCERVVQRWCDGGCVHPAVGGQRCGCCAGSGSAGECDLESARCCTIVVGNVWLAASTQCGEPRWHRSGSWSAAGSHDMPGGRHLRFAATITTAQASASQPSAPAASAAAAIAQPTAAT